MSKQIEKKLDVLQTLIDELRKFIKSPLKENTDYEDCYDCWTAWLAKTKKIINLPFPTAQTPEEHSSNAHHMLLHIVPHERGDWKPDYNNSSQDKYEPRFYMNSSGSGFAFAYFDGWFTLTYCGSRLCTPTYAMCERIAKEFLPIYKVKMMYGH